MNGAPTDQSARRKRRIEKNIFEKDRFVTRTEKKREKRIKNCINESF